MPNPSGYPAFVGLLRRSCPSEGNTSACSAQNSRVAVTPIKLTTMHKWASPTLTCTSCHVYRGDKCHPKQALSTARQEGRGVLEPLYTTTWASFSWSRPINICSACLFRWHLPRRIPPFIWLGPQPTQKCWQQWPTDELTPSRKRLLPPAWWRQTTTGLAFDSRMLKLKMKSRRPRRAPRRGAREHRIIGSAEALPILCVRYFRWEREIQTERERDRDGSDVTIVALKLAMNLHFPLPKNRTIGDELTLSLAKNSHFSFLPSHFLSLPSRRGHHCGAEIRNEFTLSIAKRRSFLLGFFRPLDLCSPSFKWHEPRDEWSKTQDKWSNPAQSYFVLLIEKMNQINTKNYWK